MRDVELHVDRQGAIDADGTNAVVVGVHGGPGLDSALIRYVLRGAARFTTVVTYEQRGHGRSEPSTPDRWNLDTWADDLAALVGVLQLDRPVLVGTSFGGFVVLHGLARHPDLARGALIVGSAARELPRDELVRRYRELGGDAAAQAIDHDWSRAGAPELQAYEKHCRPLVQRSEDPPELAALRAGRISTAEVARHFHVALPAMDLRREIAHVECPVTVVVGDHDPLVPASRPRPWRRCPPASVDSSSCPTLHTTLSLTRQRHFTSWWPIWLVCPRSPGKSAPASSAIDHKAIRWRAIPAIVCGTHLAVTCRARIVHW